MEERKKLLTMVDHTLLKQEATWEQIKDLIDDAIFYHTASVCVPPSYVRQAKEYAKDHMKICTVIGFPNGYSTTSVKVFETLQALSDGADEIDMVINIGWVKDKRYTDLLKEIKEIKKACDRHILKVIIETCLLTEDEKIKMCDIVSDAGADYIKTSTGFSAKGATFEDIALFRKYVAEHVKIKAAGGISSFEDADTMVALGASRLGTSRLVKIEKEGTSSETY